MNWQQGSFVDGKETGVWTYFDYQGNATFEGTFSEGARVGEWYKFKKNGEKKKWRTY